MLLKIKNLRLKTIIGIYDWEQVILRDIIINAAIELNSDKILESQDVEDSVSYDKIVEDIKELTKKKFTLVENFTNEIADIIVSYNNVKNVEVEVDKVGAIKELDSFSVTIKREK